MPDAVYVQARRVLLDALEALGDQRDALVLVGAQAIYLHTGEGDLAVAPYTTDGDIALDPSELERHTEAGGGDAGGRIRAGSPAAGCDHRGADPPLAPRLLGSRDDRLGCDLRLVDGSHRTWPARHLGAAVVELRRVDRGQRGVCGEPRFLQRPQSSTLVSEADAPGPLL